jgi:predicted RNase H-like HicB family nuclease
MALYYRPARALHTRSHPLTSRRAVMSTYTIVVEPEEDGGFFVVVPALPGCFTRGRTIEECRQRAVEAIEVHIAGLRADGQQVPEEVGTPQLLAVTVAV